MRTTEDMIDIILLQPNIKDLREGHSIPLWLFGDYFSLLFSVLKIWTTKKVLKLW